MRDDSAERLAEGVRRALIERAMAAHEDARLQGLCWEGAWEAAISAMRELDLPAAATPPSVGAARGADEAKH
jgi:hypothetical protein